VSQQILLYMIQSDNRKVVVIEKLLFFNE